MDQYQKVDNISTFSTLGISSIELSQDSDNSSFGGSSENDYDVDVKFTFTNGSSTTLSATLSWRKPPSNEPDIIGLYFDSSVSYTVPNGSFTISGGTNQNDTSLGLITPTSSLSFSDGDEYTR